jgi:ornithine--oxo-acid transaminase
VHCKRSFHGLTNGALSINGCESFRPALPHAHGMARGLPLLNSAIGSFDPLLPCCRAIPFNDLAALEAELESGDVAAFITEPIQGKGVFTPSPGYLAEASALCRKHGALFIVDEVQTGFGRTGVFLATEHDPGAEPDVVILSKALSGGYVPVGAVLTKRWVYDKVYSSMDRAVIHSSTFGQNALAMVAGLATLKAMDEHDVMGNAERMGRLIRDGLEKMRPQFELLHEVRQRGLMIGVQFGRPRSMRLRAAWSLIHKMDGNLFPQAITMPLLDDHRVLAQVAGHDTDCVKLIPPLIINEDDVRWFLAAFERVMADLHQFPGPIWGVLKKLGALAVTRRPREAVEQGCFEP